LHCIS